MGNICSRSSNEPDHFSTPGRTLDSSTTPSSQAPKTASLPSQFKTSPGRTLGGSNSNNTPSSTTAPIPTSGGDGKSENEAARRAREAAEQRYAQSQQQNSAGKLQQKLAEQKRKTQNQVLKEGSEMERRKRDADSTQEVRNYN